MVGYDKFIGLSSKDLFVSRYAGSELLIHVDGFIFSPLAGTEQIDRICSICCNPKRMPESFLGSKNCEIGFAWSDSGEVLYVELSRGTDSKKVELSSDSAMRLRWTLEKLGGGR